MDQTFGNHRMYKAKGFGIKLYCSIFVIKFYGGIL